MVERTNSAARYVEIVLDKVDCIVIGAGVVGLAVSAQLAMAGLEVIVLEQHELIGSETSSRNSEVIHAGIYYPSNTLKAALCVRGKQQLYQYCDHHNVPYRRCGKIIVAAHARQVATVKGYMAKGAANGVEDLIWLEAGEVHALEPNVKSVGGVLSPSTGVIDSHAFMLSLQGDLEAHGGLVALQTQVQTIERGGLPIVHTQDFSIKANWLINCAGLAAPRFAAQPPRQPYYAIGHYYAYAGAQPFARLVYPVTEEGGLGVHVTIDLAGQIKFGPDVRWIDEVDYAFDNSHFDDFVEAIRSYYPAVDPARLQPGYTGIRPKLAPAGNGFQDFVVAGPLQHGIAGCIDLLGIESPGLTASLAIAEVVVGQVKQTS